MAQDRKVFVGGVPQDLNQDDLYAIFSEYAGVKKAWLQKCRTADDGSGGNTCPPQNHRGFGFVIFHDANAIDELLGNGPSRFIVLRSGAKLEVKRALSSNKMGQDGPGVVGQVQVQQEAVGRIGRGQQQAYRGSAVNDLPSNHIVGSASQQRGPTQQGQLGNMRGARVAAATQQQVSAQVPWPAGADGNVLRLMPQDVAALQSRYHSAQAQLLAAQAAAAGGMPRAPRTAADSAATMQLGAYAALPQHLQVPAMGLGALAATQPPGLAAAAMHLAALGATGPAGGQLSGPPHGAAGEPALGSVSANSYAPLREAIMRFYHEHCPEKLTERDFIDFICSIYDGREGELDTALRQKYGTGLALSPHTGCGVPQLKAGGGGAAMGGAAGRSNGPHGRNATAAAAAAAATAAAGGEMRAAPGLSAYLAGEPAYMPNTHVEVWQRQNALMNAAALTAETAVPLGQRAPTSVSVAAGAAAARIAGRSAATAPPGAPGMLYPSWIDASMAAAMGGVHPDGVLREFGDHYAHYHHSGEAEVHSPDLTWVDSILSDDIENKGEAARAFVGKSGMQRKDWMPPSVVW
mmetsp:Transcript_20024/g.69489  ORF Transcript_20024/g.69489 Transcript_20024/m.69489 type:complete len:577 (-) Transcript_20024:236-1966(-)